MHAEACVESVRKLGEQTKKDTGDTNEVLDALDEAVFMLERTKNAIAEILIACSSS
jgi:hypothetical protein